MKKYTPLLLEKGMPDKVKADLVVQYLNARHFGNIKDAKGYRNQL